MKSPANSSPRYASTKMKYVFILVSLLGVGCASIGGTYDESKLKAQASFDTQCPAEKISIVRMKDDGMAGTGNFVLEACGKQWNYVRLGRSYFEESKSPVKR